MSESFDQTLIAIAFGALLGFITSLGFPIVQGWLERRSLRGRLKQEFLLIRKVLQENMDKGNFEARGFPRTYYQSHTKELNEAMDANTWDAVFKAEAALGRLGSTPDIENKYRIALDLFDDAVKKL